LSWRRRIAETTTRRRTSSAVVACTALRAACNENATREAERGGSDLHTKAATDPSFRRNRAIKWSPPPWLAATTSVVRRTLWQGKARRMTTIASLHVTDNPRVTMRELGVKVQVVPDPSRVSSWVMLCPAMCRLLFPTYAITVTSQHFTSVTPPRWSRRGINRTSHLVHKSAGSQNKC
jgi:hypothetical protein